MTGYREVRLARISCSGRCGKCAVYSRTVLDAQNGVEMLDAGPVVIEKLFHVWRSHVEGIKDGQEPTYFAPI